MKTDLKLRTGDKVSWTIGILKNIDMVGCVLEEKDDGTVEVLSHTNNGSPCTLIVMISRKKLTLI